MKDLHKQTGFTLAEMMVALGAGSMILAVIIAASVSMQKSLNAVDNFFATYSQQVRIINYLSRDVKRSYIVTVSADQKTVTCMVPGYLSGSTRIQPKVPSTVPTGTVSIVNYPTNATGAAGITVTDAVTTNGLTTLTSATASFDATKDVGISVAGTSIASGTTIQSVTNSTTVVLSAGATASGSSQTVLFGGTTIVYTIAGSAITRTENGVLTNIAYSTDSILIQTLDVTLTNTENTNTTVTFLPIFTSGNTTAEKSGTTVYGTAYLRNKRRG